MGSGDSRRGADGHPREAQVFDDQWARDMELPENQHVVFGEEESLRWERHQAMSYVHDAKRYWFDR